MTRLTSKYIEESKLLLNKLNIPLVTLEEIIFVANEWSIMKPLQAVELKCHTTFSVESVV